VSALLESDPDVQPSVGERSQNDALTAAILDHLNEQAVISLDTLVCLIPQYTWNQVFHCVDRLTRCNKSSSPPRFDTCSSSSFRGVTGQFGLLVWFVCLVALVQRTK
jgi:hypothetical protein